MAFLEVDGAKALRKAMKAAAADLSALSDLNRDAATVALNQARPATPSRTGRLQHTGKVSATRTRGSIRFGSSSVPYAQPIHFGWAAHNIRAQPWASEAAQASEDRWTDVYLTGAETLLDDVAEKVTTA